MPVTVTSEPAAFQQIADISRAMYDAFPENKWVGRLPMAFNTIETKYVPAVCAMMSRDIENLAVLMGHGNVGQLLMHLDYELKSNDARTVCRLEFLAKISMTQMMELSSQAGVSLVCEQLRKLLTYFRFTSDGDVARDDSRQYRMGMEGDIYIGGSDTMF